MTAVRWLALLISEIAVFTAIFLLHPPTDWLLLTIAPIVMPIVVFGFVVIVADDIRSRFVAGGIALFGFLWLGAELWPVARAYGYLPPAASVTGVAYFDSRRSARQFWPNPPWTRNCSMTIFDLDPRTASQWIGESAEARRETPAFREPRLWSGAGTLAPWVSQHTPPYLSNPRLDAIYHMIYFGQCGPTRHEYTIGYSGKMLFSELPNMIMLIDPHPRYPKAMVVSSSEL
mgnify:CR=1 FL=1